MSKVLRTIIFTAYCFLLIQLSQIILGKRKIEVELEYVMRPPGALKRIIQNLKRNDRNITKQIFTMEKQDRLPTDLKFILRWMNEFSQYSTGTSKYRNGQSVFIENNCAHFNCYITTDKSLLLDPRHFDAIIFDVENRWDAQPILRAANQKYIFTASTPQNGNSLCYPFYDSFFNLTWTYKLSSDIRWSLITIEDKKGNFVGPKIKMKWIQSMEPVPEFVTSRLVHKRKAVAWFVSDCKAKSGREKVGKELMLELARYNFTVDTYGWCGELTCTGDRIDDCLDLVSTQYYFYFSFENILCEDCVTEELLHALLHYTVPIVFGGADYTRFLPPGSYINAGKMSVIEIGILVNNAIKNPEEYQSYFRWHNHYNYKATPTIADVCKLCEAMNNPAYEHNVVDNFRKWWDPNFEQNCEDERNKTKNY